MQTRGGSNVRIYEIFESNYINGAYHEIHENKWYPVQWNWDGLYYDEYICLLDLINIPENNEPEKLAA